MARTRPIHAPIATRTAGLRGVGALLLCTFLPAWGAAPARADDRADADRRCMQCHGQAHIAELTPEERRSMVGTWLGSDPRPPGDAPAPVPVGPDEPAARPGLFLNQDVFGIGPHATVSCVSCHEDAARLPHAPDLQSASCTTSCHTVEGDAFRTGAHFAALERKDARAPTCVTCHGGHGVLAATDRKAPHHKLNSLHLCANCHATHGPNGHDVDPAQNVANYLASAHARAVTKAGLPMAATCADCHGAHSVHGSADVSSPVHRSNIPGTCGKCHVGVAEVYVQSVHGRHLAEKDDGAAVCTDCHKAHKITMASTPQFVVDVVAECGKCHDSPDATGDRVGTYYQSYVESYHGQVTRLGGTRAARCSDCHGAHDIRSLDDPASRMSPVNIVSTCAQCHPGASARFAQFDPHANYRDSKNYPVLFGVWLYFLIVMSSVFTFFGMHTILWFVRSMRERRKHPKPPKAPAPKSAIRRFTRLDRVNHLFVLITFFGLTATGIPLVFSGDGWAGKLAGAMGGIEAAGMWHRVFAFLLIVNLVVHMVGLAARFVRRRCPWREWIFGPASMVPRVKDARDCLGMFRWFARGGSRPRFDRWTYWEKFDYWAEIFGSVILGLSGLLLWFPEIAARVVPGWSFNIAMIVHGYEALLAIGFIFTIHFFNTHVRPGAFPVDEVIFTGSLSEHEMQEHRPEEYKRLVERGQLESLRVPAPDPKRRPWIVAGAIIAVSVGLILLGLIIAGGLT